MKQHVFLTASEFSRITIEAFRLMEADVVEFPITTRFRGLGAYFYKAQQTIMPVDRRAVFSGVVQRKKFVTSLNYRNRVYNESLKNGLATVATKAVEVHPVTALRVQVNDMNNQSVHVAKVIAGEEKHAAEMGSLLAKTLNGMQTTTSVKMAFAESFMKASFS